MYFDRKSMNNDAYWAVCVLTCFESMMSDFLHLKSQLTRVHGSRYFVLKSDNADVEHDIDDRDYRKLDREARNLEQMLKNAWPQYQEALDYKVPVSEVPSAPEIIA